MRYSDSDTYASCKKTSTLNVRW